MLRSHRHSLRFYPCLSLTYSLLDLRATELLECPPLVRHRNKKQVAVCGSLLSET
jgi:hypothetical protein